MTTRAHLNDTVEEGEIIESVGSTQCKEISSNTLEIPRRKNNSKRSAELGDVLIVRERKSLKKSNKTQKSRAMSKSRRDASDKSDCDKYGSLSKMEEFRKCVFAAKDRNFRKVRQERREERSSRKSPSQEKENSKHSNDDGHHHHNSRSSKRRRSSHSRKKSGKSSSRNRNGGDDGDDNYEDGDDSDDQRRSWKRRNRSSESAEPRATSVRSRSCDRHMHKWKKRSTTSTKLGQIIDDSRLKDNILMRKLLQSESLGAKKSATEIGANSNRNWRQNDDNSDLSCEIGSLSTVSSPDYEFLDREPVEENVELPPVGDVNKQQSADYSDDSEIEVIIPYKPPPPLIELRSDSESEEAAAGGEEQEKIGSEEVTSEPPPPAAVGQPVQETVEYGDDDDLDDLQLRLVALRSAVLKKHQERLKQKKGVKELKKQASAGGNAPARDVDKEDAASVDSYHPSNRTSPMSPTSSYNFSPTQECHIEQDIDIDSSDNNEPIVEEPNNFIYQNYDCSNNACFPTNNGTVTWPLPPQSVMHPQPLPPGVDASSLPPEFTHSVFCAPPPPPPPSEVDPTYGFVPPHHDYPPTYFNHGPVVHPSYVPTTQASSKPVPPVMHSAPFVSAQPPNEPIPPLLHSTSFLPAQLSSEPLRPMEHSSSFVPCGSAEMDAAYSSSSYTPTVNTGGSTEHIPQINAGHSSLCSTVPVPPPTSVSYMPSNFLPVPSNNSVLPCNYQSSLSSDTAAKTNYPTSSRQLEPCLPATTNQVDIAKTNYPTSSRQLEPCVPTTTSQVGIAKTTYPFRQLEPCVPTSTNQVDINKSSCSTSGRQLEPCVPITTNQTGIVRQLELCVSQNNTNKHYLQVSVDEQQANVEELSKENQGKTVNVTKKSLNSEVDSLNKGDSCSVVGDKMYETTSRCRVLESADEESDDFDDENEELLRAKLLTSLSRKMALKNYTRCEKAEQMLVDTVEKNSETSQQSMDDEMNDKECSQDQMEVELVANDLSGKGSSNVVNAIDGSLVNRNIARSISSSNNNFINGLPSKTTVNRPISLATVINKSAGAVRRKSATKVIKRTAVPQRNRIVSKTCVKLNSVNSYEQQFVKGRNAMRVADRRTAAKERTTGAAKQSKHVQEEISKFIIRLGQDSEEESNCEEEDETGRGWRREVTLAATNEAKMEEDLEDSPVAPVVLEKRIDELLEEVRRQHEVFQPSSAILKTAKPKNSTMSTATALRKSAAVATATSAATKSGRPQYKGMQSLKATTKATNVSTPAAVRHLPKSAQEEYRRLKLAMAEKEAARNRLLSQKSCSTATVTSVAGAEKSCSTAVSMTGAEKSCLTAASVAGTEKSCSPAVSVTGAEKSCSPPVSVTGAEKSYSPAVSVTGAEKSCSPPISVTGAEKSCLTPPAVSPQMHMSTLVGYSPSTSSDNSGSSYPALQAVASILAEAESKLIAERYTAVDKLVELSCEASEVQWCKSRVRQAEATVARLQRLLTAEQRRLADERARLTQATARMQVCTRLSQQAMAVCEQIEGTCLELGGLGYRLPSAGMDLLKARRKIALNNNNKKDAANLRLESEPEQPQTQNLQQQNERQVKLGDDEKMEVIINSSCRRTSDDGEEASSSTTSTDLVADEGGEEVAEEREEETEEERIVKEVDNEDGEGEEGGGGGDEEKVKEREEECGKEEQIDKDVNRSISKPLSSKCLPDYVSPLNYLQNSANTRGSNSASRVESNLSIFCPYELMGSCRDETCPYQHSV